MGLGGFQSDGLETAKPTSLYSPAPLQTTVVRVKSDRQIKLSLANSVNVGLYMSKGLGVGEAGSWEVFVLDIIRFNLIVLMYMIYNV